MGEEFRGNVIAVNLYTGDIMDELIEKYALITAKVSQLKKEKEELRALILIELKTAAKVYHVTSNGTRCELKSAVRKTLNKEMLTDALHHLGRAIEEFQEESTTERLTVKCSI